MIRLGEANSAKKRIRNRRNRTSGKRVGPVAAGGSEKVHEQTAPEGLEGKDDVHVDRGEARGYDLDEPETLMAVWPSRYFTQTAVKYWL